MATLGEFYRENGESEFVLRVEGAVDGEWRGVIELADAAGVSRKFAQKVLPYLLEEGRVERMRAFDSVFRPRGWRWEWRRPA